MPRYIDADALMNELRSMVMYENDGAVDCGSYNTAIIDAKSAISSAPTVSPDEVRGVGMWEQKEIYGVEETTIEQMQSACCSVCRKYHTTPYSYYFSKYNFCPNCGAEMEVSDDA